MFGIGGWEMLLIGVVALLVFGPKRLPELARSLGKGLAEFRKASSDLRRSMDFDLDPTRLSAPEPDTLPPAQAGDPAAASPAPAAQPAPSIGGSTVNDASRAAPASAAASSGAPDDRAARKD